MTLGYTEIQYGTQALLLQTISRRKVPGMVKQRLGGSLVKLRIPALDTQDWSITGRGIMYDTATYATTARKLLEASHDLSPHHYSDGLIVGSFIIEDLSFDDNSENPLHFNYTINFIEFNQTN